MQDDPTRHTKLIFGVAAVQRSTHSVHYFLLAHHKPATSYIYSITSRVKARSKLQFLSCWCRNLGAFERLVVAQSGTTSEHRHIGWRKICMSLSLAL
eukprot:1166935-Pleurochrysis_carterae.AAC.1